MPDVTMKRNDTWPPLEATLSDQDGAIDLSTAEAIHIYLRSETLLIKTGPCEIVEAAAGKVKYLWEPAEGETPADLHTSGTYKMEFEITWADGNIQTVPNGSYLELSVVDDLGPEE